MDYILQSFYRASGWSEDNSYENIVATSEALIDFQIPNDVKLCVGSKSSENTATQLTLSNSGSINGSLAYLYTSAPLKDVLGTKDLSLQDAINGYRVIRPVYPLSKPVKVDKFSPHTLYYGRMYFPGSALEAMVIKRWSKTSQLLVKCVSSDKLKNNGTMTFYWQRDTGRLSQEYIFSTNEALLGFRCLYNFSQGAKRLNTALYNNSSLSVGTELWFGTANMSPGVSTALRYSTQSTYTGKPLTMTLACNPLLGHISSTYSVKTSTNSTFSSRYDFNIYSYDSNLSFGCELWKSSGKTSVLPLKKIDPSLKPHAKHSNSDQTVIEAFESLVRDTDYSSVIKLSTSLNDRNIRFMWEGKFKEFLLSAGTELRMNDKSLETGRYGLQIQYSS
ncbi:Mdm10p CYBJADRAFT_173756 [Cyberlindnera jadinii NRRL Y-1542]|nr:hypothetical protein CYBJADRAFT_173756 [Cyberlindnera jadinii NRRL Y-1542]ODV72754.1 hypothetical protein CYBJADRAFT_173756 [Cyberlindnera jadinii NRRL Y-1542]